MTRPLKRTLLAFALALLAAGGAPARADFDAGLGAYASGDYGTALKEWRPLAEQGDVEAQIGLAEMYDMGRGVAQDAEAAAGWSKRAAEQGNARAQAKLGTMFATGHGVPVDLSTAVLWWSKAAEQGSPAAQMRLAQAYHKGEGATRDLARAEFWYAKAANAGIGEARVGLFEVRKDREREAAAAADAGLSAEPALSEAEDTGRATAGAAEGSDEAAGTTDEAHAEVPPESGETTEAATHEATAGEGEHAGEAAETTEDGHATTVSAEAEHAEGEGGVAEEHDDEHAAREPAEVPDPLEALIAAGQAVVLRLDDAGAPEVGHGTDDQGEGAVEPEVPAAGDHGRRLESGGAGARSAAASHGDAGTASAVPQAGTDEHGRGTPSDHAEAEPAQAEEEHATDAGEPHEGAVAGETHAKADAENPAEPAAEHAATDDHAATDGQGAEEAADTEPVAAQAEPEAVAAASARVALTALEAAPADGAVAHFRIWLATFESQSNALAGWADVRRRNVDVLGSFQPAIVRVEQGNGRTLYRVQAGPFATAVDAQAACDTLGERSQFCVAIAN
jgi:hypothetical protein